MEWDEKMARLWRRAKKSTPAVTLEESVDPLDLAAYLDGTIEEAAREAVERRLSADAAALDVVAASRMSLGQGEEVPARVMARAEALVAMPAGPREAYERPSLSARLSEFFGNPWRPAVGALAFGLYAFVCLASFELGRTGGLPGLGSEAVPVAQESGLFEDDEGFL